MKRTPIFPSLEAFPAEFHPLLAHANLYDSSSSPEARVIYVDRDGGYFLKSAPKGTLKREADLSAYFHAKGLGPEILSYCSKEQDWLLSRRILGEDLTHKVYLQDPKRLCDTLAFLLRALHETDPAGCPIARHTDRYLSTAEKNFRRGTFDPSYLPAHLSHLEAKETWERILTNRELLQTDTLLHGDYCLPNIILKDWNFSGFIDLGNGGVGDRHVDLFWGAWTLNFNLGTDRYRNRFFDAYGRDRIHSDTLELVALIEAFG